MLTSLVLQLKFAGESGSYDDKGVASPPELQVELQVESKQGCQSCQSCQSMQFLLANVCVLVVKSWTVQLAEDVWSDIDRRIQCDG